MTNRKDDHVALATAYYQVSKNDFDRVDFVHHNFSDCKVKDVDITTKIGSVPLDVPFFINAMTGGSASTQLINKKLAEVAKATNLVMASGSMSAALKDPTTLDSFLVIKQTNPDGIRFANVQASASVDQVKQVVAWLDASAVQLHVNVAQELIMPEGDREFNGWLENIRSIVAACEVPVIVKEVGFGFSQEAMKQLAQVGVRIIDVSGKGGTNFAQIENARNVHKMDYMNHWGQSTVCSLLEAQSLSNQNIIASGGIRNMLDVAKSLALGAKAVGISGLMLNLVETEGVSKTIEIVELYKDQLRRIMALLNVRSVSDITNTDLLFDQTIYHYASQRGLDLTRYHHRTNIDS